MIEYTRRNEEMLITCDVCGEDEAFVGPWSECIAEAKDFGWRMFKNSSDEWGHRCPSCIHRFPEQRPIAEMAFSDVKRLPSEEIE